jgi:hypothetical protein
MFGHAPVEFIYRTPTLDLPKYAVVTPAVLLHGDINIETRIEMSGPGYTFLGGFPVPITIIGFGGPGGNDHANRHDGQQGCSVDIPPSPHKAPPSWSLVV